MFLHVNVGYYAKPDDVRLLAGQQLVIFLMEYCVQRQGVERKRMHVT